MSGKKFWTPKPGDKLRLLGLTKQPTFKRHHVSFDRPSVHEAGTMPGCPLCDMGHAPTEAR